MTHKEMSKKLMEAIGLTEEPLGIYYSESKPENAFEWNGKGEHFCHVSKMSSARAGTPVAVDGNNPGCGGAAFYLGWSSDTRPGFAEFLSHDKEGRGERFKKDPELAQAAIQNRKFVPASGRYCIYQRLSDIPEEITPEVVTIFADADGISGLIWLRSYISAESQSTIAPFSAGCGSMVGETRAQALQSEPKAVLGMFDPAARQSVEKELLTFSVPYSLFIEMVNDIPGSFLEINPWLRIRNR